MGKEQESRHVPTGTAAAPAPANPSEVPEKQQKRLAVPHQTAAPRSRQTVGVLLRLSPAHRFEQ